MKKKRYLNKGDEVFTTSACLVWNGAEYEIEYIEAGELWHDGVEVHHDKDRKPYVEIDDG